jgi:hypothetical protein
MSCFSKTLFMLYSTYLCSSSHSHLLIAYCQKSKPSYFWGKRLQADIRMWHSCGIATLEWSSSVKKSGECSVEWNEWPGRLAPPYKLDANFVSLVPGILWGVPGILWGHHG